MRCDLGAGLSPADCRAEVDQQLKSRFPRFGKRSRFDDRANTYVNGEKLLEGDERRRWSFDRMGFMHCALYLLVGVLHLGETAIDKQFRACDVAAAIGCEEHHGLGDLIGCTEPAERNTVGNHLQALLAGFRGSEQLT